MALRRLGYIFIPVLAIILMSHNVYAEQYGSAARYPIQSCVSHIVGTNSYNVYKTGSISDQTCRMVQNNQLGDLPGDIVSLSVAFQSQIPANSFVTLDFTFYDMNTYYGLTPTGAQTKIQEEVTKYTDAGHSVFHVTSTFYLSSAVWSLAFNAPVGYVAGNMSVRIHDANVVLLFQPITADQISQLQQKLNSIDANIVIGDERLTYIYNLLNQQKSEMTELNDSVQERNDKEYESVDNIDNQSASDITGTDNQNTTNLIGIFSSFVTAMGNASSTNCNFDGDFGNLDLGQMNFCQDNPPTIVQVIGSLVLIAVFVPLAYFLVNRIISEIRSFTNG